MKALVILFFLTLLTTTIHAQEGSTDENGIIVMTGIDHLRPQDGTFYHDGFLLGIGTDSKQSFTAFQFRLCYQLLPLDKKEFISILQQSGLVSPNATSVKVTGDGHRYITAQAGMRIFYPKWFGFFQPYLCAHGGIYHWFGGTTTISGENDGTGRFSGRLTSKGDTNLSYRFGVGSELRVSKFSLFLEGGYLIVSARGKDPEFTPLVIGMKF